MKISKQRLLEILSEECGMMPPDAIAMQNGMVDGEIDEEGKLAKRQLNDIAKYSQELMGMLQDETQLEGWVQAKLTKAADYIKTVKHYVEYGMEEGAYDSVTSEIGPEMPEMGGETAVFEYDPSEFDENDKEY